MGLEAGRYSGTSRPDLYRTPHALHNVFGPIGPVLHCGVVSDAQWRHFRPGVSVGSRRLNDVVFKSLVFELILILLLVGGAGRGARRRRREDQSQGAARERLLRALPGTPTSEGKMGGSDE